MNPALTRFGYRIVQCYWRIARPLTLGVFGICVDAEQRVLLVRQTYRDGWFLPGGGVEKGESTVEALKRELHEEAGVRCLAEPVLSSGPMYGRNDFKHDHVMVYHVPRWEKGREFTPNREIAECRSFPIEDLPEDTAPGMRRRIEEFLGKRERGERW